MKWSTSEDLLLPIGKHYNISSMQKWWQWLLQCLQTNNSLERHGSNHVRWYLEVADARTLWEPALNPQWWIEGLINLTNVVGVSLCCGPYQQHKIIYQGNAYFHEGLGWWLDWLVFMKIGEQLGSECQQIISGQLTQKMISMLTRIWLWPLFQSVPIASSPRASTFIFLFIISIVGPIAFSNKIIHMIASPTECNILIALTLFLGIMVFLIPY